MKRQTKLSTISKITVIIIVLIGITSASLALDIRSSDQENAEIVNSLLNDFMLEKDETLAETLLAEDFIAHDAINGELDREAFTAFYLNIEGAELPEYTLFSGGGLVGQVYAHADSGPILLDITRYEFGENGAFDTIMNFYKVEDGQIIEAWLFYDRLSVQNFVGTPVRTPSTEDNYGFSGI